MRWGNTLRDTGVSRALAMYHIGLKHKDYFGFHYEFKRVLYLSSMVIWQTKSKIKQRQTQAGVLVWRCARVGDRPAAESHLRLLMLAEGEAPWRFSGRKHQGQGRKSFSGKSFARFDQDTDWRCAGLCCELLSALVRV